VARESRPRSSIRRSAYAALTKLSLVPALACVLMLAVMCAPMMFGRRRSDQRPLEASTEPTDVTALRQEIVRLQREVAQLKKNARQGKGTECSMPEEPRGSVPSRQGERGQTSRVMRRRSLGLGVLLLGVVILMGALVGCSQSPQAQQSSSDFLERGDKAPDFTLESSTGTRVSLSDFRKKDVLLYFSMGPG
jgi:hypothetical protein